MDMSNVSAIGWLHSLSCTLALLTGGWNIATAKGTPMHRRAGMLYVFAMLAANLSAFGVYHFDIARFRPFAAGPGIFGLFHWEAVATLIFLGIAVYAAPRQNRALWAYGHPLAMLVTYYMLIGGLINELFVRILPLRAMAAAHGQRIIGSPIVGLTQFAAMIVFVAMMLYFVAKVALHRRRASRAALATAWRSP